MSQKGLIPILIVLLITATLLGGYFVYQKGRSNPPLPTPTSQNNQPTSQPTSNPTINPIPTPTSTGTGELTICSTPLPCPSGRLVYGDPSPGNPNQCPRYQCL